VAYYRHGRFVGYGEIIDNGTKNGYRVYDVQLEGKNGANWGYADQFKKVSKEGHFLA